MRSHKGLLLDQCKKDPKLQEIYNSIDTMSEEDISKLDYKPWVKKVLVELLSEAKELRKYKNIETYVLANVKESFNEDFVGKVFEWVSGEIYVKSKFDLDLLVRDNDLLFVTDKGIWVDTIFIDKNTDKLKSSCRFIKECKFTEYKLEVKKSIEKRYFGTFTENTNKPLFTKKSWTGEFPT
jgi:hypothetical protein